MTWLFQPLDQERRITCSSKMSGAPTSRSMTAIAKAEGMDVTQVRRIMRLTLLAPEVVERLIAVPGITLEQVMRRSWPNGWGEQKQVMLLAARV
jgi:hypothetical protein